MALVDYSDSEPSDSEAVPVVKPKPTNTKPAFRKIIDRANPGKIRVDLPQQSAPSHDTNEDEPPAKRSKTGAGGFAGFNSFLPAPKRPAQQNQSSGRRPGVSLKTGAEPSFSRSPAPESAPAENEAPRDGDVSGRVRDAAAPSTAPAEEVKLVGKPLMFKPLSVARKPPKKKKPEGATIPAQNSAVPSKGSNALAASKTTTPPREPEKPKVSLFSMPTETTDMPSVSSTGDYEPMLYQSAGTGTGSPPSLTDPTYEDPSREHSYPPALPSQPPGPQSLNDIASDLNLSEAERRQLFGRQRGQRNGNGVGLSASNVINFNTDQEYRHNEELRAAGEQVQHNPVRSIAPGKHSLKQLVNAAQSQKEALEESFAQGKNNRKEAGSRYGW